MNFKEQLKSVAGLDEQVMKDARIKIDGIVKPIGSLGELENILVKLSGIFGSLDIDISKRAVVIFCSDNGVVAQGVAKSKNDLTTAVASIMAQRRSTVCMMAKSANIDSYTVDVGMIDKVQKGEILDYSIAKGTNDFTKGSAMTKQQTERAINIGIELVKKFKDEGYKILATGEMGIGNTTTSSAICSVLLGLNPVEVTGRGAGLTDQGLTNKINAINKGIEVNKPNKDDAFDVLQKLGGFDIAAMCGVFLGGAIYKMPILIDGFISSIAALLATKFCENAKGYMIQSHISEEPACKLVLDELQLKPIICACMRVGEGTGAVAAIPMIDMVLNVYNNTATYEEIGCR